MSTPMLARAASGCNELNSHLDRYRSIVARMLSAIPRYSRESDYLYSKRVARPLKKKSRSLRLRLRTSTSGESMEWESSLCHPRGFAVRNGSGCAFPPTPTVADQACKSAAEQGESTGLGSSGNAAKQAVFLNLAPRTGYAGGEVQDVLASPVATVAEGDVP